MAVQTMTMAEEPMSMHLKSGKFAKSKAPSPSKPSESAGEFTGSIKVSQKVPTAADLRKVADLPVLSAQRVSIPFKDLYTSGRDGRRILIIFIRHFFCGNCQEYLRSLCSSVTSESLLALPTPTEVVVIGCGQPDLIPFYAETTECKFPIYADPSKKLYNLLGMARTLKLGTQSPDYMQKPLLSVILQSVFQVLGNGPKAFKGGDYWQVGGEFIFEKGEVVWCHRMTNTRDHAEIPELRKQLGLDDEDLPRRKRWSSPGIAGLSRKLSTSRSRSWSRKRNSMLVGNAEGRTSNEGSMMEKLQEERTREEAI